MRKNTNKGIDFNDAVITPLNQRVEIKMDTVIHEIEPVWNSESRILILGTMPSPASRMAGHSSCGSVWYNT